MKYRKLTVDVKIPAMGLGCWAIGGPFYSGETPLGWGEVDDKESIRAIHAAIASGINLFNSAQVYGTGHSEEVLGQALIGRPDILVTTKIGHTMDHANRQITGTTLDPQQTVHLLDNSLKRLNRERIDMVYLHLNDLPVTDAKAIFECLDRMRVAGKVGAFGWSTDFADRAGAFEDMPGFQSLQFAMNVFLPAHEMVSAAKRTKRSALIRSPLAMGLLSGKYTRGAALNRDDVRAQNLDWLNWFEDGKIAPEYQPKLAAIGELLQSGGRSMVQGAIGWLWAMSDITIPIPGFRTETQVMELAAALEFGPLPQSAVSEINGMLDLSKAA